jgi:hypothetical protein
LRLRLRLLERNGGRECARGGGGKAALDLGLVLRSAVDREAAVLCGFGLGLEAALLVELPPELLLVLQAIEVELAGLHGEKFDAFALRGGLALALLALGLAPAGLLLELSVPLLLLAPQPLLGLASPRHLLLSRATLLLLGAPLLLDLSVSLLQLPLQSRLGLALDPLRALQALLFHGPLRGLLFLSPPLCIPRRRSFLLLPPPLLRCEPGPVIFVSLWA